MQNSILSVSSLALALVDKGFNIKIILPVNGNTSDTVVHEWFRNSFNNSQLSIASVMIEDPMSNRLYKYILPSAVLNLIEQQTNDCIITRSVPWGLTLNKHGFNTIIDLHTHKFARNRILNFYLCNRLIKNSYKNNNLHIIAISQTLAAYWLINNLNRKSISFAHNGFDASLYLETRKNDFIRSELNLKKQDKIVLYSGSFWPDRGIDIIIKAAKLLPGYYFVLLGGPTRFREPLEDQCRLENVFNVRFLNPVTRIHLPDILFSADVLLGTFSSKLPTAEYFSSLKIMEYMATGIPIVTQDYAGIRELIQDGISGYLAKPDDVQSLATKIKEAMECSSRNKVGQKAREYAFNNLTWENRAEKFHQIINEINH